MLTGLIFSFFTSESESRRITGGEPTELALNMIPSEFFSIYQAAEKMYGVPWNLLAAQHKVETDFSGIEDNDFICWGNWTYAIYASNLDWVELSGWESFKEMPQSLKKSLQIRQ